MFKVGDKVNILNNPDKEEVFTISEMYNNYFYSLDEKEIAHLYLQVEDYENIYFAGELRKVSI